MQYSIDNKLNDDQDIFVVVEDSFDKDSGILVAGMNKTLIKLKPRETRSVTLLLITTKLGVIDLPSFKVVTKSPLM